MILSSHIARTSAAFAAAVVATSLCGCHPEQIGVTFADGQAKTVDKSWITAARTCWPDMTSSVFGTEDMNRYLADPLHFRAAFSGYSTFSDAELRTLVTRPVPSAPAPDAMSLTNSSTPVFTRSQAIAGTSPRNAAASNTNGSAPPDAFCAAQPGTPVGFK